MLVPLTDLWLPILLSAAAVFVLSSLVHMVLGWHNRDYAKLPDEDEVIAELQRAPVKPGTYIFPSMEDPAENMKSAELMEKWQRGPAGMLTVFEPGDLRMGRRLSHWFLYCVVLGVFVAYLAGATRAPGAGFASVFQLAGTVAFLGYSGAVWPDVIWKGASPSSATKMIVDGLAYGLATGAVFAALWP